MADLPEGMRISLAVYVTSDSSGIDTVISACNAKRFDEGGLAGLIDVSIKTANEIAGLTDFRAMTCAEIEDYLTAEEEVDNE